MPQNWIQQALQNPAAAVVDDIVQGPPLGVPVGDWNYKAAIKKPLFPKEPPVELNIKAKKPDLWTPILTYEQYVEARKAGMLIAYQPYNGDETREYVYPQKKYSKDQIESRIKHKLAAHTVQKVRVYAPVMYADGLATIWHGRTYEEFDTHKTTHPKFVKQLSPLQMCIYEGDDFV